jgi:competence ComEA-like helix-hairpin-helix protein
MWKQLSGFFSNTKKERSGNINLIVIVVIFFCLLPFFYPFFISKRNYDHSAFEKEITALKEKQTDSAVKYQRKYADDESPQYYQPSEKNYTAQKQFNGELFYFDPNTLDEAGWQRLGVRDKTIATIQNYLSKGGKFRKPEDIDKIWGLNDDEVKRLTPYVKIQNSKPENSYGNTVYDKPLAEPKKHAPALVDINTADTTAFIALPGIGSKLSQRIISFRDKLGGFYKIEQVAETFGLPDSTFQKIKARLSLNNPSVKQININAASVDELKSHPYLRYTIANAIIQYKNQHGNFSSLDDLKKVMPVTDEVFAKVYPYLKIN